MEAFVTAITGEAAGMAGNIATVAGAALAIMAVLYGIRLAVRAFKSVK